MLFKVAAKSNIEHEQLSRIRGMNWSLQDAEKASSLVEGRKRPGKS